NVAPRGKSSPRVCLRRAPALSRSPVPGSGREVLKMRALRWKWLAGAVVALAVGTVAAPTATAQTTPITFRGPGSLTNLLNGAISGSGAQLIYIGGDSDAAETGMLNHTQLIGPMFRNLNATIIGSGGSHTTWKPGIENVVGLSSTIVIQKNRPGSCP